MADSTSDNHKKKNRHIWSTYVLFGFIGIAAILFAVEAANNQQIFVSTPTHAEAYYLEVNGTLILQENGAITCNSTYTGAIYWDGSDHYSCNSTAWRSITSGGGADGYCDGQSCNVANTGTLDGYEAAALLDNTDSQTLTWNDITNILGITGGNTVNLTNLSGGGYDLDIDADSGSGTILDAETLSVLGSGTVSTQLVGNILTISGSAHTTDTDDQTLSWNDATDILTISEGNSVNLTNLSGGVSDHGALTGLADDDHPQYLNQARFDSNTSGWDTNAADDFSGAYGDLSGNPTHLSNFTDNLGHIEDNTSWNESYADTKYSTGAHYTDADIDGTETAFDGWDKNAGDDFDGAYGSLTGTPTVLSNFTDDLGHVEESTTNGTGLSLSTYQLAILLGYRLPQSCADGEIAEYNTSSGGWDCATDDQAASGMSNWVLAASGTGGSETITEGETVTFNVGGSGYLVANRSTNNIYYNFNTTKLDANYVGQTEYPNLDTDSTDDLTLSAVATNLGNWSADKPNYALTSYVDTLGNWSADSSSYYTTTQIDNQFSSLPNLTLGQIATNIGNWSADQSSYTTGAHTNDADILAFGYNHTTDLTSYYDGRYSTGAHYTTSDFNTDFATKTTDNLAEGTTNLYDNQSWNESHADSKYSTGAHTTNTWQNYVWNFDSDTASPTAVTNATTIDWAGAGTVTTSHTGNTITITGTAHLTLSAVAANVGNWSADKSGYYTTTQVDTLGNWSADSSSYSTTSQANDLYAEDGANTDITSMTGLTGEVKTSSYTNYTQTNGNVQYFSQGCVMKSNSTGIYFIC